MVDSRRRPKPGGSVAPVSKSLRFQLRTAGRRRRAGRYCMHDSYDTSDSEGLVESHTAHTSSAGANQVHHVVFAATENKIPERMLNRRVQRTVLKQQGTIELKLTRRCMRRIYPVERLIWSVPDIRQRRGRLDHWLYPKTLSKRIDDSSNRMSCALEGHCR